MLIAKRICIGNWRVFSTTAGLEVVTVEAEGTSHQKTLITKIPWAEIGIEQVKFRDGGAGSTGCQTAAERDMAVSEAAMTIDGIDFKSMDHAGLMLLGKAVAEATKLEMARRGLA